MKSYFILLQLYFCYIVHYNQSKNQPTLMEVVDNYINNPLISANNFIVWLQTTYSLLVNAK